MKKILLTLIITCFIGQASAQNSTYTYEWAKLYGGALNEAPGKVKASADGNLFLFGDFVSSAAKESLTTKYDNIILNGAPDTTSAGNYNMVLYKVDRSGKHLWNIHSTMGNVSLGGSSMTPTKDGGAFLALKVRITKGIKNPEYLLQLTDQNESASVVIVPDNITKDPVNAPYIGILVRILKDGEIDWIKRIEVNASTEKDVLDLNSVAEDADGNFYLGGSFKDVINIYTAEGEKINLTPRSTSGDLFLMKLNTAGDLLWNFTTSGDALAGESIDRILVQNNKILLGATLKGNGTSSIQFGTTTIKPTADTDLLLASLNADKTVNWAKHCPVTVAKGIVSSYALFATENELFVAGKFAKGFKVEDQEVTSWKNKAGSDYNQGYMMKCNLSDGKLQYLNGITGPFAELWGIHKLNNTVFCSGYYSNGWPVTSSELADLNFGNGITIAKDAGGSANNKGDIFLASYDATTGKAFQAENIAQGAAMETCGGGSEMIDNQIFVFGRSQSDPLKIGGNSLAGNGGFDCVIASFTVDATAGIENITNKANAVIYTSNNRLYINSDIAVTDVTIYNIVGSVISKAHFADRTNNIDMPVSTTDKGIYVVQIRTISGETKAVKVRF